MALRIDTAATSALQYGGREAPRAEASRRREAGDRGAEGATFGDRATIALAERLDSTDGVRGARLQRILDTDPLYDSSVRNGARAYLAVERNTISDPAGGELVGIDIYI